MSSRQLSLSEHLAELMKARFPYVYIPTFEEDRAMNLILSTVKNNDIIKTVRSVYVWTQTDGFICYDEKRRESKSTMLPLEAINFIAQSKEDAVFVLKDFHVFLGAKNRIADAEVVRKMRDIIPELKSGASIKNVIVIAPELVVPDDMQKEISVFEFPLPTEQEIRAKLDEMVKNNTSVRDDTSEEEKERIVKSALGLTLQEAENAFARAMVRDKTLGIDDLSIIFEEKNQTVKKTGILEFVKSNNSLGDIGGLENLKRWIQKRNNSWLGRARLYNLPSPKGVLITGVPGCGKSLTAKTVSTIWKLPLLKLDMGRIFSGVVGSSEENMRTVIQTAEAVAPSVLWIDEIEKGLSGSRSSGDSGVGARIFGTFLSWMQDKTEPVFVIATANDISGLPPELLRKGRFDEIFFVDLPTFSERRTIFDIHLKKRLKGTKVGGEVFANGEVQAGILDRLAQHTEGFVGAEIEQIVIAALFEAFFEERMLTFGDLKMTIENMVPLSITQQEQIKALREWANVRAVAATSQKDLEKYSTGHGNEENVKESRGGRTIDF